jgi:hypothetical protein
LTLDPQPGVPPCPLPSTARMPGGAAGRRWLAWWGRQPARRRPARRDAGRDCQLAHQQDRRARGRETSPGQATDSGILQPGRFPTTCMTCAWHSAQALVVRDYLEQPQAVQPQCGSHLCRHARWQSLWQSGRCHNVGRDVTSRTADPTRPAAMLRGITSRTDPVLLLIRKVQVRILPGRQTCRSEAWQACWRNGAGHAGHSFASDRAMIAHL